MNESSVPDFNMIALRDAARVLVEEIRKYGFSTDTMASERLITFCKRLAAAGHSAHANRAEELDRTSRRDAEIYALLVIGKLCVPGENPCELFRRDECGR